LNITKNVLVCPLDWGLGHACRCVPIIHAFIEAGANVIIAADGRPLAFLQQEFPSLTFIRLKGYGITYQKKGSLMLKLFSMLPTIIKGIYSEHIKLKEIIEQYKIDIVFSDNRFGLWNKKLKCVFMTHQLLIKSPIKSGIAEYFLYLVNKMLIHKFDECWLPDFEGEINLSGDLSHKYRINIPTYFIGPLSRFKPDTAKPEIIKNNILVMLSGPEPQRSILEEIIIKELKENKLEALIVRGVPEEKSSTYISDNIEIFSHLDTLEMQKLISQAELIVCRSGYSTIMDLAVFGKKAILIPTPGQTEQEYLAEYYREKQYYYSISQKEFNLCDAIAKSVDYKGIQMSSDSKVLYNRVSYLLNV
jgi:uncharacterized protein (TIGR00661 family)